MTSTFGEAQAVSPPLFRSSVHHYRLFWGRLMRARRMDSRLVKIHRCYSLAEAAQVLGVHKNTIANWLRQGLQTIDKTRPLLIQGAELRRFLQERRRRGKSPCREDELYCFRCRAPRHPDGGLVDYRPMPPSSGNLSGLCPQCGCLMHRRVSSKQLTVMEVKFDIAFPQAQSRLKD